MGLFSKTERLPGASDALPGRAKPLAVPETHFVNGHRLQPPFPAGLQQAVFGMGCFWGAERLFWQLPGVYSTAVGYAGGLTPNPTYEEVCSGYTGHNEVVKLVYDPAVISTREVLEIFFVIHDPTTLNRQGNDQGTQYRSGIYYANPEQKQIADDIIAELTASKHYSTPIVTEVLPPANYSTAEDYHQDYFARNPTQGYCMAVAAPKVAKFRKTFARLAK